MAKRPICERMAAAKAAAVALNVQYGWRRNAPKAFYLNEADWAEFIATSPPTIDAIWRDKPRAELGFDGLPVRQTTGATTKLSPSKLYSEAGRVTGLPVE